MLRAVSKACVLFAVIAGPVTVLFFGWGDGPSSGEVSRFIAGMGVAAASWILAAVASVWADRRVERSVAAALDDEVRDAEGFVVLPRTFLLPGDLVDDPPLPVSAPEPADSAPLRLPHCA